jgi:hypothetical protein
MFGATEPLSLPAIIGAPLVFTGVVMLMRAMWVQHSLIIKRLEGRIERQAKEIEELEKGREADYLRFVAERREHEVCDLERRAMMYAMRQAGLPWDRQAWREYRNNG